MKKFFIKLLQKHQLGILSVIYFLSRLINLTRLPIFNDEAIYLDWGWRSLHTSAGLFYSLYDAKPPLLIWIFGVFQSIFQDPLFAGRFVSVLAGFITLIGIYKVAKNLGGKKLAVLSSILYIIIPLFTFFDRQALMESSITTVGIWSFYFLERILETKKINYSIFLGFVLGIGIFIKLSVLIFLIAVVVILIYKKFWKFAAIAVAMGLAVLSPLYSQNIFWSSLGSNNRFMLSFSEVLNFPFSLWLKNVSDTINISFFHLTPFIFVLSVYGIYLLFRSKKWLLPVFFLLNIVLVLVMSRSLNPRYLTSFLAITTILCSYTILSFKKIYAFLIGGIAILMPAVITTLLIFSPITYFNFLDKITGFSEKDGYINNWTSGYGIPETVNYVNQVSKDKNIILGVRLDAGNPESAMFAYFDNTKNIKLGYIDVRTMGSEILSMKCIPSDAPVYFVARDGNLNGLDKFFTEERRFYKPEKEHFVSVHVLKKCS